MPTDENEGADGCVRVYVCASVMCLSDNRQGAECVRACSARCNRLFGCLAKVSKVAYLD